MGDRSSFTFNLSTNKSSCSQLSSLGSNDCCGCYRHTCKSRPIQIRFQIQSSLLGCGNRLVCVSRVIYLSQSHISSRQYHITFTTGHCIYNIRLSNDAPLSSVVHNSIVHTEQRAVNGTFSRDAVEVTKHSSGREISCQRRVITSIRDGTSGRRLCLRCPVFCGELTAFNFNIAISPFLSKQSTCSSFSSRIANGICTGFSSQSVGSRRNNVSSS